MLTHDRASRPRHPIVRGRAFVLLAASAVLVSGLTWAIQEKSAAPVVLRPVPGKKGRPVRYVPGEQLLVRVLQDFASSSGEPVYIQSDIPPDASLTFGKRIDRLTEKAASSLLRANGYELSTETYRGKEVFWVQKPLVRKDRRRGALTPSSARSAREEKESNDGDRGGVVRAEDRGTDRRDSGGRPSVCLYRRQDGSGARYVVIFETSSKKTAEDVLSLIEAQQSSSRSPRPKR